MPTAESEGLACLADGTAKAIIYEPDWKNELVMMHHEDDQDIRNDKNTDDKLRIRKADIPVINIVYIDADADISELGAG
jgi:hypothetical protein